MVAAFMGNIDIFNELLNAIAPNGSKKIIQEAINHTDTKGNSALTFAAQFGHTDMVEHLLAQKANPDQPSVDGWTPIMHAALNGHVEVVRLLIAAGARTAALPRPVKTTMVQGLLRKARRCCHANRQRLPPGSAN